jgi:hypothetical protein
MPPLSRRACRRGALRHRTPLQEVTPCQRVTNSPVLADMESSGAIKIAGAMYNLQSGVIDFFSA